MRYLLAEKKQYDWVWPTAIIDNTQFDYNFLTGLEQGDAENERVGKKVQLVSLFLNADIRMNNSATATGFRVVVISSNLSQGEPPNIAMIFQNPNDYRSVLNMDYAGKDFWVLCDRYYSLNINGNRSARFYYYKRFKKHVVDYIKNDVENADDESMVGPGHIYVYTISNESTGNAPAWNLSSRIVYYDS